MKKIIFYLIMLATPFLLLEVVFRLLPTSYPPSMEPVSSALEVPRFVPDREFTYSKDWDFSIRTRKRANNMGFINLYDYDPQAETPLLMVIGDSFVQANEVDKGKSAAEVLHREVEPEGRVYSIGFSGAPLSQYLVQANYAVNKFQPGGIVFVIIANDFDESLIEYKAAPQFHYFEERDGELILELVEYAPSPVRQLLRRSAFLRYLVLNVNFQSRLRQLRDRSVDVAPEDYVGSVDAAAGRERFEDAQRAVDEFLSRVSGVTFQDKSRVLFVMDGVRPDLYAPGGIAGQEDNYDVAVFRYFAERAQEEGYSVVDMGPRFSERHRRDGSTFEFPTDLHWNELGNQMVADAIAETDLFKSVFSRPDAEGREE